MKRIPALLLIMALGLGILTGTAVAEAWSCPECGQEENNGNFCTNCGAAKPAGSEWTCPGCNMAGNTGNFCPNCGTARPGKSGTEEQENANPNLEQIPGETDKVMVRLISVDASEFIEQGDDPSRWQPSNAADGNETTCWQHTARNGAWLELNTGLPETVDEIWFKNGFWAYNTENKDQYSINARPKKVTIQILYNGEKKYREAGKLTLADEWGNDWQRFSLGHHENVTAVRIVIQSVYKGSFFKNDVCLSEVMLVQHAPAATAMPARPEQAAVIYESRPDVTGCSLLDQLATRSGPSTIYAEPGTFFYKNNSWKNQTIRVLKKAKGNGVWWVQVDFQNGKGGKKYRVWTGAKRVDVDLEKLREEIPIGDCDIYPTKNTYWGPGKEYAAAKVAIRENAVGQLYAIENGYADVEYFCDDGTSGRVWVPREAVHGIDTNKDRSGEN